MTGLMIGELARQAGVATSALRYYEKAGLLAAPARTSNRRRYDRAVLVRSPRCPAHARNAVPRAPIQFERRSSGK